MGVTSALVFANIGAAYGTAKSGVGISSMGVMNPGLVMRNIIPVVMAGVLGIYGLIVAVIIQGSHCITSERTEPILFVHWLCTLGCWLVLWSFGSCCWYGHWYCRRCWCTGCRTTREALCWYDFDSHFRRGSWSLRTYCRTHLVPELIRLRRKQLSVKL